MKNYFLIYAILFSFIAISKGQTVLLTEDFETDGEGTRYTSNSFDNACNDFFERYQNGGGNCLTNEPNNVNGTYYWAGEDVDVASGGTGIVTLNALTVSGYDIDVDVLLAIGRPNDFRFEPIDEFLFEYNMDNNGWNQFAAFYGSNDGLMGSTGNLVQDADLNGAYDPGGAEISTSNFVNWNFTIPVTGNSLQIRFVMGHDAGTEEVMVDYIRINGTVSLPVELSDFSLRNIDNEKVKIDWQTLSENNNDNFIIERSKDALFWMDLLKIKGAGSSNAPLHYSAIDPHPLKGLSYYRLKQTDLDGSYSYSDIEKIRIDNLHSASNISIYPNPANEQIRIEGDKNELSSLQVFNVIGNDVSNMVVKIEVSELQFILNTSQLPDGVYFIKTKTTTKKVYIKHSP